MNRNPIKCGECGRFVLYADLESGRAKHHLVPDSDRSLEEDWFICPKCSEKETADKQEAKAQS